MIARAAVVPYRPLPAPELLAADVPEVSAVRRACGATAWSPAEDSRRWIAIAPGFGEVADDVAGTFRGFGADVRACSREDTEGDIDAVRPPRVLIAGWLREQAGVRRVSVRLAASAVTSQECRARGARLAEGANGPVGLLASGDGPSRHGGRAPACPDLRASEFGKSVHTTFENADMDVLVELDQHLGAHGRASWQVLAGTGSGWHSVTSGPTVPFGVGRRVRVWDRFLS